MNVFWIINGEDFIMNGALFIPITIFKKMTYSPAPGDCLLFPAASPSFEVVANTRKKKQVGTAFRLLVASLD